MGIDVGSSSAKVRLIDRAGTTVAFASCDYQIAYPRPGWVEVDPEDWFRATSTAIRRALSDGRIDPSRVGAVACVGPAHSVALLGENGEILAPTLHWSDLRAAEQSAHLESLSGDRIFELSMQRPNPSWTLCQLRWLRDERPAVIAGTRRIFASKDYVRHRLTGDHLTDRYDAIGTQLFDARSDAWSGELCELAGINVDVLPTVAAPSDIAGHIGPEASEATGLAVGTPVVVGGGDSSVEAAGVGAIDPGDLVINLGTAAATSVVTSGFRPGPKTITYSHVAGGYGFSLCATNAGSGSLRWFRERLAFPDRSFAELVDLAGSVRAGSEGLIFHPFLQGERSPYWDPHLRADFIGVSARHRFEHFTRAVLEGVAFSVRDCVDALGDVGPLSNEAILIGGGSRSDLWSQIISDVTGLTLRRPDVDDSTVGAALLAGIGIGTFSTWEEALDRDLHRIQLYRPTPANHDLYNEAYDVYRDAVGALRDISHRLATIADRD